MHAGDLFRVVFRHQLPCNAVWIRGDFKLSFEFNFHYIIIIIEGFVSRKSDMKCQNVPRSTMATEKNIKEFFDTFTV
jgi:hypothetical protein